MIIVPKRKLETGMPGGEAIDTAIVHAEEVIIGEIQYGYTVVGKDGEFTYRLKIPARTDWYD